MTPDDDATPERGRRADRGRRSAAQPSRAARMTETLRTARAERSERAQRAAETAPAPRPDAAEATGPAWLPRWIRRIDRRVLVTTLLAMLGGALVAGVIITFGLGLIFVTDACDVDAYVCDDSLFTIGYGLSIAGPLVLTSLALLVALIGMIRGRTRPWLVVLIGTAASLGAYILGAALVLVAVPGSSALT